MCSNDPPKPKAKPDPEIRPIGDAEDDLYDGNTEGYIDKGGLEGDRKREAARQALAKIRDTFNPIANLGIFAQQETTATGAEKLKNSLSSANPFYASMAAASEARQKSDRQRPVTAPVSINTQPLTGSRISNPGAGYRMKIGG